MLQMGKVGLKIGFQKEKNIFPDYVWISSSSKRKWHHWEIVSCIDDANSKQRNNKQQKL